MFAIIDLNFFQIWETIQNSKEFQEANKNFNETLRQARERSQNEFDKKREKRWQKFTQDEFSK